MKEFLSSKWHMPSWILKFTSNILIIAASETV
jgi:hypothetical protein